MKKIIVLALSALLIFTLAACGKDKKTEPTKTYSGKVYVDCMNINNSDQCLPAVGSSKSILSAATTSLSDLVTTITTTYEAGDISIATNDSAWLAGSIVNDTADSIRGFYYCNPKFPATDGSTIQDTWIMDDVTLDPGQSISFGGRSIRVDDRFVPGPAEMTVYFFDLTNDTETQWPTIYWRECEGCLENIAAFHATHTPRAVGTVTFTIVP